MMNRGIRQRFNEITIYSKGKYWTSNLRIRNFSTKMSTSPFEVLRGIPWRVAMQDGEEAMVSEETSQRRIR